MFYNDIVIFFLDRKILKISTIFALFVIFRKKVCFYHYLDAFLFLYWKMNLFFFGSVMLRKELEL